MNAICYFIRGKVTYEVIIMSDYEYKNLKSVLASTAIEGFKVDSQTEDDCIRLISGVVTIDGMIKEILSRTSAGIA